MSGTSVDGLDIALCEFSPEFRLLKAQCFEFPERLRATILDFCEDSPKKLDDLQILDRDISQHAASCVNAFLQSCNLASGSITAIGFHGQTLRHLPQEQTSLQCGNPSWLAESTGIDVIADFRSRDLAAGGQGAPLVPAFHKYLIQQQDLTCCAFLNLGGIANLTLIDGHQVIGYDTGPASVLMDYWIEKSLGRSFDQNGDWAALGEVDEALLSTLHDDFFLKTPPKSTGRELFNASWLNSRLSRFKTLPAETVQRTLLELTVRSIADQLKAFSNTPPEKLYVCGGGANNRLMMRRLGELLSDQQIDVLSTNALNLNPDWVEAAAFAWLAMRFNTRQAGNLPSVTGAAGERILGALYPA